LQSISGGSAINPLVAYYRKLRIILYFTSVNTFV
jgi:hypothetical protein